jgi:xanthine/uracil permease
MLEAREGKGGERIVKRILLVLAAALLMAATMATAAPTAFASNNGFIGQCERALHTGTVIIAICPPLPGESGSHGIGTPS